MSSMTAIWERGKEMQKKSKKIHKGEFGYICYEKKKRGLITLGLFALPMAAYIFGVITTGTNANLITVVAMVGCLPACRSLVGMIMMWMQKPMDKNEYEVIQGHAEDLVTAYECFLTSPEKNTFVDCFAVCGNKVVGYFSRIQGSAQFTEQHVRKILKQNGYKVDVKVFTELKTFTERLDYLRSHKEELTRDIIFEPDSRYPGLSREELIKHIILAISL